MIQIIKKGLIILLIATVAIGCSKADDDITSNTSSAEEAVVEETTPSSEGNIASNTSSVQEIPSQKEIQDIAMKYLEFVFGATVFKIS